MGQQQSRRSSNASTTPLTITANINPPDGQSSGQVDGEITGPAPPPVIYRLSELIDPVDFVREESQALREPSLQYPPTAHTPGRPIVQSPSGQMLDAIAFAGHANRPLSLRERQEEIMRRTIAAVERTETPARDWTFTGWRNAQDEGTAQGPGGGTGQEKRKSKSRGCFACLKPGGS